MVKQHTPLSSHGSDVTRKLGQTIRQLRLSLGLSPGDLSEYMGCSTSFVIRLEEGTVDADLRTLEKCSTALGVELSYLLSLAVPKTDESDYT